VEIETQGKLEEAIEMMRKMFVVAVGAVALLSMGVSTAQATTISLLFQSSGGQCTAGLNTCSADVGDTILIDVQFIINNNTQLIKSTSVGLDLSAMGLANTAVSGQGFPTGQAFAGEFVLTLNGVVSGGPANAAATADAACVAKLAGCDHRFTSFGYGSSPATGSGLTYTAGTITMNLTGATPGTYTIITYTSAGVDTPNDNSSNPHNSAILTIIPEPGTASLLGLGMLGLVMAGRRRS
jgi:hypothetical protein